MMITCSKCDKEFEQFKALSRICKPCIAAQHRAYMIGYRERNPGFEKARTERKKATIPGYIDSERERGRKFWHKLRHEAMMAYGGYECACCGETEPGFLTLDHANNDGSSHRKEIGNRGAGIFAWLKKHGYPKGFQILCFNCNCGKARNKGICPHHERSTISASARRAKRLEMESIPFVF